MKFGQCERLVDSVYYARKEDLPLAAIIPSVIVPMLIFILVSVYCYRFGQTLERCPTGLLTRRSVL